MASLHKGLQAPGEAFFMGHIAFLDPMPDAHI
jgi:hypothetical protein